MNKLCFKQQHEETENVILRKGSQTRERTYNVIHIDYRKRQKLIDGDRSKNIVSFGSLVIGWRHEQKFWGY